MMQLGCHPECDAGSIILLNPPDDLKEGQRINARENARR
jgi:hypothetical protein